MLLSPVGSPRTTFASLALPSQPPLYVELRLPIELIIEIVEIALLSCKKNNFKLNFCLVSSWMREVAMPFIYSTIILENSRYPSVMTPARMFMFIGPHHLSNPIQHIRHLWVEHAATGRNIWLNGCSQLNQLAMDLDCHESICISDYCKLNPTSPDRSPCRSFTVIGQTHPSRWAPITQSERGLAFLRGLTHLRLLNMCLSPYIPLEHTPNLTHLCIPFFDLRATERMECSGLDVILQFQNLKMVVLTLNRGYWRFAEVPFNEWARMAMEKDERLYTVVSRREDATRDWDDARKDWESEARGEESIWDRALKVREKLLARSSNTPVAKIL